MGAFPTWKYSAATDRAGYLFKAAELLRQQRFYFNALEIYEVGKSWVEADADVAEAIDFLEFYAREAVRLAADQPVTPVPGEVNELFYIPLGVGVVIRPWNFPGAIMAGLTSSALVAGNTVILKPASTAAMIAGRFADLLEEAGLPAGVVSFLPGPGAVVGDALVQHPLTRFISFTGSRDVGLRINDLAAKLSPGQIWIKRAILETGGKGAIIVDETADLESAATAIVTSAFGFQGQKCSACSRATLLDAVFDTVLEMVIETTRQLTIGPTVDTQHVHRTTGGCQRVQQGPAIHLHRQGRGHTAAWWPGARTTGVLHRTNHFRRGGTQRAPRTGRDFDEAIAVANGTQYGLTGSLFSTDRARVERAKREFHVGNLYINRKCIGALVGGHPFGGFNMSGTDSKAGGQDYLLLFMQGKAVSEKVS